MLVNLSFRNLFFTGLLVLSIGFWYFVVTFYIENHHHIATSTATPSSSSSSSSSSTITHQSAMEGRVGVCVGDANEQGGGAAMMESNDGDDGDRRLELEKMRQDVNRLASRVPLRIVVIDTPETHAQVRTLVGSVHHHYTPASMYDATDGRDESVQREEMHVIVYGTRLNSMLVQELLLWKNVQYVDIWEELIKVAPISRDSGHIMETQSGDHVLEHWRPFVIKHALERHNKVLYVDSRFMLSGKLDEIDQHLNLYGSYFVEPEDGKEGKRFAPKCDAAVQGYVSGSYAHRNLLTSLTQCTARKCSWMDLGLLFLDGSKTLPPDTGEHPKSIECQPIKSLRKQIPDDRGASCFIHTREDILLLPTQIMDNAAIRDPLTVPERSNTLEYKTHIAIGMPSTSKNSKGELPNNLPVFRILLPSLLSTINRSDDKRFYFRIYVVFDEGDSFYDNDGNQQAFRALFDKRTSGYPIELHLIKAVQTSGWTTYLWNIAFQAAMDDGCDYFYQVNDDLRFIDREWAEHFVGLLANNSVYPNLGAVGPHDNGNSRIFTQSFVHRTHYKIFGYLYPPTFKNWFSDDWITVVYDKVKSAFFTKKKVHNTNSVGTRYVDCGEEGRKRLATSKSTGQSWIDNWLRSRRK